MQKTIHIVSPDNVEIEYKLASIGVRLAAVGIDYLIQMAFLLVIGGVGAFIAWQLQVSEGTALTLLGAFIILNGIVTYGYFVISDVLMKGQTIGKKIYHLRIIRENGEGLRISHILIREFIKVVIDPLGIGVIMMFYNKKGKRLGDLAASTLVVEEEKIAFQPIVRTNGTGAYGIDLETWELLEAYMAKKEMLGEQEKINFVRGLANTIIDHYHFEKMAPDISAEAYVEEVWNNGWVKYTGSLT